MRQFILSALTFGFLCGASLRGAESEWRGWRGPRQDGHSEDNQLPLTWTPDDVLWRSALPGKGQSSPVVVGDRLFLTSALENGRQRLIICLDRSTGKEVWSDVVWTGEPEPSHNMNGWASATCTTDGERVYTFFGAGGGLACYTAGGRKVWQKDLGTFEGPWGTASGPRLAGDVVIQNCDADVDAFIAGFDKRTGKEIWRTKRDDARGWSTPILMTVDGRTELIVNGDTGVRAYAPADGKELWYCKSFSGRGTPTVTPAGRVLHVISGLRGDTYAVRPGGNGDVTDSHMEWHLKRNCSRDLPAPIVLNGQSIVMDMRRATLTSYDFQAGKENWTERVAESATAGQFCATPVAWNETAFFVAESGMTYAIQVADGMKLVSINEVNAEDGEIFRSAITPDKGQILLRSQTALYCIGK